MMISTKGRYALRVMVDLAQRQVEGYLPLKEIAQRQQISEKYLESIVRDLVRGKFIEGVRGKGGGYRLACPPDEISVLEVLRRLEGTLVPVACLEEDAKPCPRASGCRTLPLWEGLNAVVRDYLVRFSVQDLVKQEAGKPD